MRCGVRGLMVGGVLLLAGTRAAESQSAFTLSADPQPLVISEAVAGSSLQPAFDASTMYSVEVSQTSSLVARLDGPLPSGVTLRVRLQAPMGATEMGTVTLTTLAQTVVAAIPAGTYTGLGISYELSATVAAGAVNLSVRQVVFEVVANEQ